MVLPPFAESGKPAAAEEDPSEGKRHKVRKKKHRR
jgi:hypothetical protein